MRKYSQTALEHRMARFCRLAAVDLEGKRVLLSGATGGLGRAIAEELAGEGAKLVLSSRKKAELQELARSLQGGARRHKVIVSDLAKVSAAEKLVEDAGDVDVLVANAALPASGKLDDFSQREIERALRVNLESPIKMARALAPRLVEKGEGHLVFISSLSGRAATARSSLYSATKYGLRGFAFGLREDLYSYNVGVSIVSPGFVRAAGMFAESGAKPPPGVGTTTPQTVAKQVARAIARNASEIAVAPRRQRALANFAMRHPELAGRIMRRGGTAAKVADEVASGQADKR
jgi:short-subunit dehydrogenase